MYLCIYCRRSYKYYNFLSLHIRSFVVYITIATIQYSDKNATIHSAMNQNFENISPCLNKIAGLPVQSA